MSTNLKLTLGLLAVAVAVLALVMVVNRDDDKPTVTGEQAALTLVRDNSHRLSTAADGKVTVVEFLDFECESCGAAYPDVEKLRAEYGDRITYVVRYFPIASHPNAYNDAHAAEAAAMQGKFEDMYKKLFDNQTTWGHNRASQVDTFVGYARDLGLDVDKFRADMDSPAVDARVRADAEDGQSVGVSGTPTFFINGEKFDDEPTYAKLKAAIDAALAK
ncbi:hypothetical protein GCM10009557_00970 [Virgisporangium ochraceum]|uniref:Thioredoxin domain-containing protein n=1 Tax=Virgisporangium ochraceum TaxID=65505 RepID=A0A8J4A1K3_9ACTN|nr:thioredoxin domain-containing protein [Virgisporangium ochraceum]GIJ74129.1 hypothetical protein Voc01_090460 [Virgisporangium ochraceum]